MSIQTDRRFCFPLRFVWVLLWVLICIRYRFGTVYRSVHQTRNVGLCLCRPVKNKKSFLFFYFGILIGIGIGIGIEVGMT